MSDAKRLNSQERLEQYFSVVEKERLWSSRAFLTSYLLYLFAGTTFENRRVLDIGGGRGLFTFYAACMGAKEVVCLEPDEAGGRGDGRSRFDVVHAQLPYLTQVRFDPTRIQDYQLNGEKLDILLLHNSINHMDEEACIELLQSEQARQTFRELFTKLATFANRGAKLIITDCSRHNLFALLRMRNPFAPSIEWHKHQSPNAWARMLEEAGFHRPQIRWTPFTEKQGSRVPAGKVLSFFHWSHFCLSMEKA